MFNFNPTAEVLRDLLIIMCINGMTAQCNSAAALAMARLWRRSMFTMYICICMYIGTNIHTCGCGCGCAGLWSLLPWAGVKWGHAARPAAASGAGGRRHRRASPHQSSASHCLLIPHQVHPTSSFTLSRPQKVVSGVHDLKVDALRSTRLYTLDITSLFLHSHTYNLGAHKSRVDHRSPSYPPTPRPRHECPQVAKVIMLQPLMRVCSSHTDSSSFLIYLAGNFLSFHRMRSSLCQMRSSGWMSTTKAT